MVEQEQDQTSRKKRKTDHAYDTATSGQAFPAPDGQIKMNV